MGKLLLIPLLLLSSCAVQPKIIPNTSQDSAMVLKLKNDLQQGSNIDCNWGWILWYAPIMFLVVAWGYRELIAKKPKPPKE